MKQKLVWWLITVAIMAAVFNFSSQPDYESNSLSMKVTEKIVDITPTPQSDKAKLTKAWNNYVRKYAHFTMFFLLGIAAFHAWKLQLKNKKLVYIWLITLLFCVLYASSDEIHQIFVPGRGCQFTDVLIDLGGSFLGSVGVLAGVAIKRKVNS